MKSLI